MPKQAILVNCKLCGWEWSPADLSRAGICPGCREDLAQLRDAPMTAEEHARTVREEREREQREAAERQRLRVGRELGLPYVAALP